MMRVALNIAAALLVLTGCVWILQGINIIPGSFMTGQLKWALYGTLSLALGIVLLFSGNRRLKRSRKL